MAKKAILRAGIVFEPKDIDTSQIKKALIQSIAQAKIGAARGAGVPGAAAAGGGAARGATDIVAKTKQQIAALQTYQTSVSRADQANLNYFKLLRQGATSAEEFGAKIGQITTRFSAYLISLRALFAVQQAFNASLRFIFEFDDALQDLQKVLQTIPAQLEKVARGIFQIGQETGNSALQVAESFNVFIRTGISVAEALDKTRSALIAVNISELNVNEATKLIISSARIFGKEMSNDIDVLDILSVTADNAATSAGEIGRGLLRAGAAAQAVGISFKELNALIAATEEATKLGGGVIGSAFKTIFARAAANTKQFREQANALGANITIGDSVFDSFVKLSRIWDTLNKTQRQQISQTLAGKRRFTEFNALVLSIGKAQQLLNKQQDAAGTALRKNQVELDKLSTKAQQTATAFAELISEITGLGRGSEDVGSIRDSLSSVLDVLKEFGGGLTEVVKFAKDLNTTFLSVSSVLKVGLKAGILLVGVPIIKKIIAGFAQFTGLIKSANTLLSNTAIAQGSVTQQIQSSNRAQQRAVDLANKELQIRNELDRITGKLVTGGRQGRGITFAGAIGPGGLKGALSDVKKQFSGITKSLQGLGAAGLLIAVQSATDAVRVWGKEIKDSGDKFGGAMADATVAAGEIGSIVGLVAGPLRGLAAGAVAASISFLKYALDQEKLSKSLLQTQEKLASRTIRFSEALKSGSDLTSKALVEFASESSSAQKEIISTSALLDREWRILQTTSAEFAFNMRELASETETLVNKIAGIDLAVDFRNELSKVATEFRQRELELRLDIDSGGAKQLSNVNKATAETQANLEKWTGTLKSSVQLFGGIQVAQAVIADYNSNIAQKSSEVLERYGLVSDELKLIIKEEQNVNKTIGPRVEAIQQELENRRDMVSQLEAESKILNDQIQANIQRGATERDIEDIRNRQISAEERIKTLKDEIKQATKAEEELESSLVELRAKKEEQAKKDLKNIQQIALGLDKIVRSYEILSVEAAKSTNDTKIQTDILRERAGFEKQISIKVINARTLAEKENVAQLQLSKQLAFDVLELSKERVAAIDKMKQEVKNLRAAGNLEEALKLENAAKKFAEEAQKELEALNVKAGVEFELKLEQRAVEEIKRAREALTNFEIRSLDAVLAKEEQNAQRRIDLIEKLGETALGQEFLKEEFKPSQYMEREFGLIGGIIVDELDKSTETAIGLMIDHIKELKESGADAFEVLSEAQQTRINIEQRLDELTQKKREVLLGRVQKVTDAVAESEQELVNARNKLPELNQKVIDAQRTLAGASASVDEAIKNLHTSMKAAADASAELNFNILKAEHDIRSFTGSIEGASALSSLRSIFSQIENQTRASGEKLLQIRAQIAQEEINILKQQFNTFKSLGLEAATATEEQFAKIQEGLAVAAAITGGAGPEKFTAEQLAEALKQKDLFAGLERTIAEFGLEKLGLNPDVLQGTEDELVKLSKLVAQTGQEQVNAANAQVLASQQQLVIAEEQRASSRESLKAAQGTLEAQVQMVNYLSAQTQASVLGFRQLAFDASKQLAILNEQRAATDKIGTLLGTIDNTINSATKEIVQAMATHLGRLNPALSALAAGAAGAIPTVAGGSLSAGEIGSLIAAARREKQLMPAGSRLMLANTSETVLTRGQARNLGLKPIPKAFAAEGNAAIERSASTLASAVNLLTTRLNDPNFVNQTINVQVDTERQVNVRGLDAIDSAMRQAFEARSKGFVSKEEQKAIGDIVANLVGRLSEMGVVNSKGI